MIGNDLLRLWNNLILHIFIQHNDKLIDNFILYHLSISSNMLYYIIFQFLIIQDRLLSIYSFHFYINFI